MCLKLMGGIKLVVIISSAQGQGAQLQLHILKAARPRPFCYDGWMIKSADC
jgi:hypothetical protein